MINPRTLFFCFTLFWLVTNAGVASAQVVHFSEDSFDKATFSQLPLLQARQECLDSLHQKLQRVSTATSLNAEACEKLRLAGELDIHRFFNDYAKFKRGIRFGNIARDQWQKLSMESRAAAKPYTQRFLSGLHGSGSLWDKLITRIANAEQLASISTVEKQAALVEYEKQIDAALLVVGRQVALTVERRQEIKTLLITDTTPPTLFGTSLMPLYFVLARMGEVEPSLRKMFNDEDWRAISKLIDAGKTATQ